MKFLDIVKVVYVNEDYKNYGVKEGDVGTIIEAAIRDDYFLVVFPGSNIFDDDIIAPIRINDLEFVKSGNASDELILNDLPKNDPRWWCKVEDGYILNLLGERKNKIPYDYNS